MNRLPCAAISLVALALAMAPPAWAHHSFAMFDNARPIRIAGTVKEFSFANPHAFIEVLVLDGNGKSTPWSIECVSPNMLKRRGWTNSTIKPGDKVELSVFPLRANEPGGALDKIRVNGKPVGDGTAALID